MKLEKILDNLNSFEKNSFLKVKIFAFILTLLILTSPEVNKAVCQVQKSELTLNLEKGKSYHQIMDAKGTNGDMEGASSWDMSYLVKAIHDSYYDIEVKYEKLSMELPYGGTMLYSSEKNNKEDILSMILAELINKPFSIKMEKNGNIKELSINDSVFANIFDKFPELTGLPKQFMETIIMGVYGEETFKGDIEMVTAIFPDQPVSKGDKWLIKTQSGVGMNLNIETTYELKEITNSYYKIYGKSKIETADKDTYIESFGALGAPTKSDLKGTRISEILIDIKSG